MDQNEKLKQYQRDYYLKNKEYIQQYHKQYYKDNRYKILDHYHKNKNNLIEYQKKYNQDKKRYSFCRCKQKSIEKALSENQRRADEFRKQLSLENKELNMS